MIEETVSLLNDKYFKDLEEIYEKLNPIIITRNNIYDELMHTNILAWLLNPNNFSNGNLLKLFLEYIQKKNHYKFQKISLYNLDYKGIEIYQEWSFKIGRIDLLIVFPENKFVIVLENKIETKQKNNQLEKYRLKIENSKYQNFEQLFLYHTMYEDKVDEPKDPKWLWTNYREYIIEILDEVILNGNENCNINNFLISYRDILLLLYKKPLEKINEKYKVTLEKIFSIITGINFNSNSEDERTSKLKLLDIFHQKKEIFELIFQIGLKYNKNFSEVISETLSQKLERKLSSSSIKNELIIKISINPKIKIYSRKLNKLIYSEEDVENNILYFELWINVDNPKITLKFYIGSKKDNTDKNVDKKFEDMYSIAKEYCEKKVKTNQCIFNTIPPKYKTGCFTIYNKLIVEKISLNLLKANGLEEIADYIISILENDFQKLMIF